MADSFTVSAPAAVHDGHIGPATLTVTDGVITAIADTQTPGADVRIAPSDVLLPGAVDTHVHLNEPGRTEWEGFATGTRAAAAGGVTTVLDMPLNSIPPTTTPDALATKREAAAGKLSVDLGYWGGAVPQNLGHLEELWEAGVFGFKCFTLPSGVDEFEPLDAAQLRTAMTEIAGFGGLLIVHAEDARTIDAAPSPHSRAYSDFLLSRPDEAELKAIGLVIDTMRETGCQVHLLHLSSARGLDLVAAAKAEGLPLTVETCPHYLCLAAESIPDGTPEYKCCPPIRDRGNQDALWQGLTEGLIDIVVTDHSPTTRANKYASGGDLSAAWGGVAGVQVGYTAMLDAAASHGVGLERIVEWMSEGPARIMGVPAKGGLTVGHDADLAVWSARPQTIDAAALKHRNPISAWHGHTFAGTITDVWLRGALLGRDPEPNGHEIFRA
ncbi:Allantoinase [Acidipropionibacterium acidipropionici ATCC 4875]|jgi:allantoinase|uniref:allantoinase n=1 Tax=Acidipropionibacterium acidipropionici (strain ATCC 4875 / DSM 20272 / JCM 6432 / NBRC 12425 / NCIMB 8070 / 4) TaxID=1171373 RepID=K7SGL7_ACIA4|nr:allantoinase AllB [Acidipropionibacterium acidipropionici]AFV88400.1 Allantoinase [Acidipropionibacterium acidipropionici ATCC 4875]